MFSQLVRQRRTIHQFENQAIDQNHIDQCLEAAIWAPNHGLTQPWRFFVIGQQSHAQLVDIYARTRADKRAEAGTEQYQTIYQKACEKFKAIPQVVLVGQQQTTNATQSKEDYAACACAIQNFQLMAWELGLGVQWSTGPIIQDPQTYQLIGTFDQDIELIGVLYIGYPACVPNQLRKPIEAVTQYLA